MPYLHPVINNMERENKIASFGIGTHLYCIHFYCEDTVISFGGHMQQVNIRCIFDACIYNCPLGIFIES